MNYKVGDKVRVKSTLEVGQMYGGLRFRRGMDTRRGRVNEIMQVLGGKYRFEHDAFDDFWTDEMLEPVVENPELTAKDVLLFLKNATEMDKEAYLGTSDNNEMFDLLSEDEVLSAISKYYVDKGAPESYGMECGWHCRCGRKEYNLWGVTQEVAWNDVSEKAQKMLSDGNPVEYASVCFVCRRKGAVREN